MALIADETRSRVLVERAPARTLKELFSAGFTEAMAAQTLQELGGLESVVTRMTIRTQHDFERAWRIKGFVGALWCYLFNHGHAEAERRVAALEGRLGRALTAFARRYYRVSPEANALVRYLLWPTRYYASEDLHRIVERLLGERAIFRPADQPDEVMVRGPHLASADNVTSFRADGSQFRRYATVCVPQAYYLGPSRRRMPPDLVAQIPIETLPEFVHRTSADTDTGMRGAVKISMSWKDKARVREHCRR